jgi:hypothetical protein
VGQPDHLRPHPKQAAYSENFMANNSRYHGLQTKVERRFTGGLSLLAAYTWSHSIDAASTFGGDSAQNFYDRKGTGYGNSQFDLRHNFIVSSLYQLPFGPGRRYLNISGPAGKFLEGWDINSIVSFHSGFPYNMAINFDNANIGGRGTTQRPDIIGNPTVANPTPERWFNPAAFAIPARFTFGNVGRNTMIGPGFKNFDLALHKTTKIWETHAIEFRAEFFNAFNNVNFGNPSSTIGSGTNPGVIGGTRNNSREIQFALKYYF